MSTTWHLKVNAETREVREWGVAVGSLAEFSFAPHVLTLIEAGSNTDAADLFVFEDDIEIFQQVDGGAMVRRFAGQIVQPTQSETGPAAQKVYRAESFWRLLNKDRFRQTVKVPNPPGQTATYDDLDWEHVFLGYQVVANATPGGLPWVGQRIYSKAQIAAALDWVLGTAAALGQAAPFQIGTLDLPEILVPVDEAHQISCAEVVVNQMRWTPGASSVDWSTTPPTLNITAYSNMPTATGSCAGIEAVTVNEYPDLTMEVVALKYEIVHQTGYIQPVEDIWPLGASDRGFKVFAATIQLAGPTSSTQQAFVESEALALGSFTAAASANRTWFLAKFPELNELGAGITVHNLAGTLVDGATHDYELLGGAVPEWLGASARDTLSWRVSYELRNASGDVIRRVVNELKTKEITSTDTASGYYDITSEIDAGDSVPATGENGLAHEMYKWLSQVQRAGTWSRIAEDPQFDVGLGQRLNLTGGKTEWATMAAAVQGVTHDIANGRTEINFGFPAHLDFANLFALYRVTRQRFVWSNPQVQAGAATSSNSPSGSTSIADRAEARTMKGQERFGVVDPLASYHVEIVGDKDPAEEEYNKIDVQGGTREALIRTEDLEDGDSAKFRNIIVKVEDPETPGTFTCLKARALVTEGVDPGEEPCGGGAPHVLVCKNGEQVWFDTLEPYVPPTP